MYKAVVEKQKTIEITCNISLKQQVEVFFFKNPIQTEPKNQCLNIDFSKFFFEDWEHQAAIYASLALPYIKR